MHREEREREQFDQAQEDKRIRIGELYRRHESKAIELNDLCTEYTKLVEKDAEDRLRDGYITNVSFNLIPRLITQARNDLDDISNQLSELTGVPISQKNRRG